jgi:TnpA family transposase
MAESCPGTTYAKLAWLQAWHIHDETYSAALAEVVNAQYRQPFSAWWGDGSTSSSDGQNFKAGGQGHFAGQVNLKYGQEPGVQFYTHISDQYAPFHTKVINATVRDATHVLDGLLYHESDLRIEEHYTDTAASPIICSPSCTSWAFDSRHVSGTCRTSACLSQGIRNNTRRLPV